MIMSLLMRQCTRALLSATTSATKTFSTATAVEAPATLTPQSKLNRLGSALVVLKQSRWEHESERFNLSGDELHTELESRGYPVDRILASHLRHRASVELMLAELAKHDVATTTVHAGKLTAFDRVSALRVRVCVCVYVCKCDQIAQQEFRLVDNNYLD
jgi:hypothetical protein